MDRHKRLAVVLTWKFSPRGYFARTARAVRGEYTIEIADGRVQVWIDASLYDLYPSLRQELYDAVNDWFLGAQLVSQRPYALSEPAEARLEFRDGEEIPDWTDSDGMPAIAEATQWEDPPPGVSASARSLGDENPGEPDHGGLAQICGTTDPVLASLSRRYDFAVRDPKHQLARLYAVREALASIFGHESTAQAALGIGVPEWSRIRELADGELRGSVQISAEGERAEAQAIALRMILGYVRYREGAATRDGP